jgi:hypothetical protein
MIALTVCRVRACRKPLFTDLENILPGFSSDPDSISASRSSEFLATFTESKIRLRDPAHNQAGIAVDNRLQSN